MGKAAKQNGAKQWKCSACDNLNYRFRDVCNKCQAPKDPSAPAAELAPQDTSSTPAGSNGVEGLQKGIDKPKPNKQKKPSPRQRVKKLTQEIIQFAKRKRLADAKRVFQKLLDEGLTPGTLTFSTFINAHVASGDMLGAEEVFQQMRSADVAPNRCVRCIQPRFSQHSLL